MEKNETGGAMGQIIKATKLRDRGFSRCQIQQLCRMEGSPFYQITERGAWWCDTDKLDKYLDRLAREKETING